ncbi:1-aminocyclopropane-1-carboxylate deaminase/D-cysteine desulfhydrase [Raineya orbicola]|jgi:1-aminocyclopropane-1-carboxylate deaminase|uniref:1-aminocyclopropane-1-carboxylate deaminase n=1 Tax=Raineya orbicola TaxID=2016530 RepID=A0A2N3IKC0_9BACT|nr:pyridoxal-phosphate dependent enzyme [Raineya orbicola]PKQ70767.1 1-aminocyclopropane-1-carboxylate deaminase [Raineya orbicola]
MIFVNTLDFLEKVDFSKKIEVFILRLDKIDSYISGNKWFKLKYNLQEARKLGLNKLLTFGGAYSNHIVAVAAAGKRWGFETIGVIRGEKPPILNERLLQVEKWGMELYFVSRQDYQQKKNPDFIQKLEQKFGNFYLIPEGGSNALAVQGTSEILDFLPQLSFSFDYILCCVGTGGTLAGLARSLYATNTKLVGIPVLKNASFLYQEIYKLLQDTPFQSFELLLDYHFGGYAKKTEKLSAFIQHFEEKFQVPTEFVYTGKMFFAFFDLLEKNFFLQNSKVLLVHTGGVFR